jgi:flagellar motor switch protein FliN
MVKHQRSEFTPITPARPLWRPSIMSRSTSPSCSAAARCRHQVLRLGRGAIIELDSSEEDEVRILANNMPVARGTVIVSGNRIAVEVKELLLRSPEVA